MTQDGTATEPTAVRRLETPAAQELAELAAMFDELQTVLRCCERLVAELAEPRRDDSDVLVEALWTTAVLSYTRCFTGRRHARGLTEDDVKATGLQGEVVEWHGVLRQLRSHYADPTDNPRERFTVGATQGADGLASGIAITSTGQPRLDEVTVRQTGALAYELSKVVDGRIGERQQSVREAAGGMSREQLDALPLIDIAPTDGVPADEG